MSNESIVILATIAALVGVLVGYIIGEQAGRNAQWCDDFIERGHRERARRDRIGRFREKATR